MSDAGKLAIIVDADISALDRSLTLANQKVEGFTAAGSRQFYAFRQAVDPVGVAAEKMGAQIDRANAYLASGRITVEQHAKALQLAKAAYDDVNRAAQGAAKGHGDAAAAAGINRAQLFELQHVARSAFDSLAAGASPLRVLTQEGGRLAQVAGEGSGGMSGALRALAGVVLSPVGAFVALAGALAVAIGLGEQFAKQQRETQDVLRGAGAASGETVVGIDAIADAAAKAGEASRSLALEAEQAFLRAGATSANLAPGVAVLRDFAALAGEDVPQALKTLAGAYADPTRFAEQFGGALLNLTAEQIEQVRRLQEMGDKAQATSLLLKDIGDASHGAARDLRNGLGQALDDIKIKFGEAISQIGQLAYALTHKLTPAQELANLTRSRDEAAARAAPRTVLGFNLAPIDPDAAASVKIFDARIAAKQAEIAQADAAGAPARDHAAAVKRGRETAALVDAADPYDTEIRKLKAERDGLLQRLNDPGENSSKDAASIRQAIASTNNRIARQEHRRDHVPGEGRARKGPADQSDAFDAAAQRDLDAADKSYASAVKEAASAAAKRAEVFTIAGREALDQESNAAEAQAQRDQVGAELNAQLDAIRVEQTKVLKSKNDAHRAEQLATLQAAADKDRQAAAIRFDTIEQDEAARREKIARDAVVAALQEQYEQRSKIDAHYDEIDKLNASFAVGYAAKRASALTILGDDRRKTDAATTQDFAVQRAKLINPETGAPVNADAVTKLGEVDSQERTAKAATADEYALRLKQTLQETEAPLAKFVREGKEAASTVGDALQDEAVKGLEAFNDGLAEAIVNGKSLGDVFSSVFKQMEADLIRYLVKQAEIGVLGGGGGFNLLSLFGIGSSSKGFDLAGVGQATVIGGLPAIPKFADGGVVPGVGGPRSDNVLALLSPGEVVLSHNMLDQLSRAPVRGGGSVTAPVSVSIDARGADQAGLLRVAAEVAALKRDLPGQIVSTAGDALGRGIIRSGRR